MKITIEVGANEKATLVIETQERQQQFKKPFVPELTQVAPSECASKETV